MFKSIYSAAATFSIVISAGFASAQTTTTAAAVPATATVSTTPTMTSPVIDAAVTTGSAQTTAAVVTSATATTSGTALRDAQTTPSDATTTAPVRRGRVDYDAVKPDEDATSEPLEQVTATSDNAIRAARMAAAVRADAFTEPRHDFVMYKNLAPGDSSSATAGKPYEPTAKKYPGEFGRQPAGPLTGRVMYCSAGHGWTNDNTSTSLWYTQRPSTHGIVEDFGNLDQMNLFADLCFRAGATIVPMRPIGFQHIERVIDNESSQAGFHGLWADSQSTSSFGFAGAKIPYRFARASAEETAVAQFRPVIPVTDEYPVYAWARSGADRVLQTYRVVHAGGVTEVDVDHRRVGSGWVYLGSYFFKAGNDGYVEITNRVRDTASVAEEGVVIADAIRFGNGMGDINRGGGISLHPREEEASRYWVERALPAGTAPFYNAFEGRDDQSNNVGSAPRYAAFMNRENDGNFFDRLFLSFHTNAVGGRGVMSLYNSHAVLRPDHQIELAKITADELNREMTSTSLRLKRPWFIRGMRTIAHINFGEIRRDYINNEMSATIVEVAFHDNADDAALLRQLSVRRGAAQSAYRGALRFLREVGKADVPVFSPPNAPRLLSVSAGATSGTILVQWEPASQDPLSSQTEDITYRVFTSPDGLVFGTGINAGTGTRFQIEQSGPPKPVYVRVAAVSPGGQSLPSEILGAMPSSPKPVLLVHGARTATDDLVLTQTAAQSLGSALARGNSFARLVPRIMNNGEQIPAVGAGLKTLTAGFESIEASQLSSITDFQRYAGVAVMLGRQPVPEALTTTKTLTALYDYVTSGGRLLISGATLAEVDAPTTESLQRWGTFAEQVLQVSFGDQTSVTEILKADGAELTTVTLQLGDRNRRYFMPQPTELLVPGESSRPVLAYQDSPGAAAVATLKEGAICTAVVGFPLEELARRTDQAVLTAQIFLGMGLKAPKPPAKPGVKKKKSGDTDDETSATVVVDTTTTGTAVTVTHTTSPAGHVVPPTPKP